MGVAARANSALEPYVVPPSQQFEGNDGSWSTFHISVGTPGQNFRVLPSTKSGATLVISPDACQALAQALPNCPSLRGIGVFNSKQNTGFQSNASSSWSEIGMYGVDLESNLDSATPSGLFGLENVALGKADSNALSLGNQAVAQVALDYFMGLLPLGQVESKFADKGKAVDSLLSQLRNNSKIPSLSYAYTAGAKYQQKSVFGSLVLGGYDSTRFEPTNVSFTFSQDPNKLLTVGVETISATNTLKGTFSFTSNAYFSVIDSTVAELWLPTDVCNQFEQAFGLTYDPQTDLYRVNDTIHEQLLSKNPTINIQLANSLQDSVTNVTNIQLPYAAFDLQASYPYYQNATNYFPIRRAANDSQYVLGRTLLQQAYLIVDYERGNFTVAKAKFPDPLPAANIVTIISPTDSNSSGGGSSRLSTGAIVGIAVGAVVLFFLAVFAFFFLRKRRARKSKKVHELGDNSLSESDLGRRGNGNMAMKSQGPSELSGTPLTELASPVAIHYPSDQKSAISVNDTPAELHAESRSPTAPRWEEVRLPLRPPRSPYDDGDSNASRSVSQLPSDDGYSGDHGLRSAVSPLTGHFNSR